MRIDRRFLNVKFHVLGILNEPPVTNSENDQYIVGSNPSGAFANADANSIAKFDGSNWIFIPPSANLLEVLNIDTAEILNWNGTAWVAIASLGGAFAPVLNVIDTGNTLPVSASQGDIFLNTTNGKIYTATADDTWDAGIDTTEGSRYVSLTDKKLYVKENNTFSATNIPDGSIFLSKADNCLWIYNSTLNQLIKLAIPDVFVTENHSLNATEATNETFNLSQPVKTGQENSVFLSVSGVIQTPNVDFTISGKAVSWGNKALHNIGLVEGDVFIISYPV